MEQRTTLFLSFLLIATFFYGCGKKHGAKLGAHNNAIVEAKVDTPALADIKVADSNTVESIKEIDDALDEVVEIQPSKTPSNQAFVNLTASKCDFVENESNDTVIIATPSVTQSASVNTSDVSTSECLNSIEPTATNVANEITTTQSTSAVFYLLVKAKQMLNMLIN